MISATPSDVPTMAELKEVEFKATGSFEREPIAIVGMAAKFPQEARTVEDLWNFLLQARQAMTDFPKDRINRHGHYHPDAEHGGTVNISCTLCPRGFLISEPFLDRHRHAICLSDADKYLLVPRQRSEFPPGRSYRF